MNSFTLLALLATTTQATTTICTFSAPTECTEPQVCLQADTFVKDVSTGNPLATCQPLAGCNTALNMLDKKGSQVRNTCSGTGAPTAPTSAAGFTVSNYEYPAGQANKDPCNQSHGDKACVADFTCGFLDRSALDISDAEKATSALNMRCIASEACGTTNDDVKADCTQPTATTTTAAAGADGDYVKRTAGQDCHKTNEKSGCVDGHQCGSQTAMGVAVPEGKCIPTADCGKTETVLIIEMTMECSATAVAASMVSAIAILTQM